MTQSRAEKAAQLFARLAIDDAAPLYLSGEHIGQDEQNFPHPSPDRLSVSDPSPDRLDVSEMTPHQIYDLLDKEIYGQEEAKRAAAMVVYNHSRKDYPSRRNLVMAGPTGCGQTEIWRVLQHYYPRIEILDAPRLASDGWRGSLHLYDGFDRDDPDPGNVILVLDEMDKALAPRIGGSGTDASRMIQNELLKIMDGDTVIYNKDGRNSSYKIIADCSKTSVVFCGTFADMLASKKRYGHKPIGFYGDAGGDTAEGSSNQGGADTAEGSSNQSGVDTAESQILYTVEDLIKYGNMRDEIAGRISQIVALSPMTQDDYLHMLNLTSSKSPLVRLSDSVHKRLSLNDHTREELAATAAKSGLGVRYLRSCLQRRLDEQVFDCPDEEEYDLSS